MVALDMNTLGDRIAGSLFGLGIGDALGADTEGLDPDRIQAKYGYIQDFLRTDQVGTDDTEFTLFYAQLLHRYGLELDARTVAEHWLKDIYHESQNYKGAGFSETLTLQNLLNGLNPPISGRHLHSWSDGLAMCATVFGCVHPGQPALAAELTARIGQVSHAGEGIYAGQAVAAAVAVALMGASGEMAAQAALAAIPADCWTFNSIQKAVGIGRAHSSARAAIKPLYKALVYPCYPWADLGPEAVGLAFGLLLAGQGDYPETVLAGVNMGRDADTIAAIAGGILGARTGLAALPQSWCANIGVAPGRCIRSVAGVGLQDTARLLARIVGGVELN